MAEADTQQQLVKIWINDIPLEVPKGELIVEAVKRLGLQIPIFCYHKRLEPVGMCRMCLVEAGFRQQDGSTRILPKPQTGCTLRAQENLVVYTDTERVREDRKGVLEFLLINHPLDCPICDRGGECPLQNNTLFYGPSTSRFIEEKRHLPKAFPLSRYVTLDLERCIQCGRCVRFTEEISGDSELAFFFRGAEMQPLTYELTEFESKFSGNTIEICPVGALTSSQYRFRARPWDLETKPAICLECSNGCNTWFDYRIGKVARINGRTNEAVNEEWTCDKGKFGHDYLNTPTRLTSPLVREDGNLREVSWGKAYEALIPYFEKGGEKVAGLTSGRLSNEDYYLFRKIFREHFRSENFDHRWHRYLPKYENTPERRHNLLTSQMSIEVYEREPVIFIFGKDLADEQPILYLRVRKAWLRRGAKIIVASHERTYADRFADVVLHFRPGTEMALLAGLTNLLLDGGAHTELKNVVSPFTLEETERITGIPQREILRAAEILRSGFAMVASRSLYDLVNGEDIVSALANLAIAGKSAEKFNLYATEGNEQGALEIGIFPRENGMNTREILEACAEGRIRALWLVQCDPFKLWKDTELVQKALENVPFLVVQDIEQTEAFYFASVVLPACAFCERDGSYTNMERRVQRVRQIMEPKGHAKPHWKIFSEISLRIQPHVPPFQSAEVMSKMGEEIAVFRASRYSQLEGEGVRLPQEGLGTPRVFIPSYRVLEDVRA
ncbi:MAG TPA: NADH-quinone oxidoreductase subunit NuoG [Fimbriimonadales bacterium]|nr:NADH-quinone oxidoreductase subunit NuoG [Fimbriimonadales bacterium]